MGLLGAGGVSQRSRKENAECDLGVDAALAHEKQKQQKQQQLRRAIACSSKDLLTSLRE